MSGRRRANRHRVAAAAIQIVCPLESTAETQPQLHAALLRLSAIISQYFMRWILCADVAS
jgi:hypothetical protein